MSIKEQIEQAVEEILANASSEVGPTRIIKEIMRINIGVKNNGYTWRIVDDFIKSHPNISQGENGYFWNKSNNSNKHAQISRTKKAQKNIIPTQKKENQRQLVQKHMERILREHTGEIGAKSLLRMIMEHLKPGTKDSSIRAQMSSLARRNNSNISGTPTKGEIYYSWNSSSQPQDIKSVPQKSKRSERDYYKPFAQYLEYGKEGDETLNECTKAVELGDNVFRDYWATPDVIGIFEPKRQATIKFNPEIVSAEIKNDDSESALMTAFGQTCSYRLFSHKTYLVVPKSSKFSSRLLQLCHIFGIGLVFFDANAKELGTSIFETKLVAQKHEPDYYYVNLYIAKIVDKFE